ncbi:HPP family protein [Massilia antarctica]|uniref:HPP family protein n=1 Tax=Massilia antarctica TaxID=2765360 RepID=UPI0006BB9641|nr:HPP family protein [Massilia sp. H27-R4]
MSAPRFAWLTAVLPPPNSVARQEQWRASVAAFIALGLTGALCSATGGAAGLWLIAPMGASAVLLFCLPASPLAQPWAVIGGNVVSALVGVACIKTGLTPAVAAPLAGGMAIVAMFALRCLHPPGGAMALTAVLAGPAVHKLGFGFALTPVALNCVLMVGAALAVNQLTGHRYPHRQQSTMQNVHDTADAVPTARLGFRRDDLDAVLARYGEVLDVSRDDLEGIILATETAAYGRRFGVIRCGQIMSTDVVTLEFGTALADAWGLMQHHQVHALPVLNRARWVIGIVTQADFLRHSDLDVYSGLGGRLRALLQRSGLTHSDKPEVVGQIMTARVATAHVHTPIVELVPLMANAGLHHIPVVDDDDRFAGIVTQSDLVAALYQGRLAELAELAPAA